MQIMRIMGGLLPPLQYFWRGGLGGGEAKRTAVNLMRQHNPRSGTLPIASGVKKTTLKSSCNIPTPPPKKNLKFHLPLHDTLKVAAQLQSALHGQRYILLEVVLELRVESEQREEPLG